MGSLINRSNGNGGLLKNKPKKRSLLGFLFSMSFELTIGKKTYKWSWNLPDEFFVNEAEDDSALEVIVFKKCLREE